MQTQGSVSGICLLNRQRPRVRVISRLLFIARIWMAGLIVGLTGQDVNISESCCKSRIGFSKPRFT